MSVALGIDTGGTYTDAVLVDHADGAVLAQAKARTTKHDLAIGIGEAMHAVLSATDRARGDVRLVSLSTTLATNAIVEGHGAPICALLIGYEGRVRLGRDLTDILGTECYALIPGGHLADGDEYRALDLFVARRAILEHAPHVASFAVSGYFGTRNPAHEQTVRALVRELTSLPVTCGHELTPRLDALRRAATVCLNARLIPLLCDLVDAVRRTMRSEGLDAPLMVVRGDGSLMSAEAAMERPVETILSGPAASVVGARHLAGGDDVVVVDMGGTTTDIAILRDGSPRLNPEGAQVGAWRTMVETIDVHTAGLGGDSRVWLDVAQELRVGPQRVVPISWLAARYPDVHAELQPPAADGDGAGPSAPPEFWVLQREYTVGPGHPPFAADLRQALGRGPLSLYRVHEMMAHPGLYRGYLSGLESEGHIVRAGFTPTDAAHVLGRFVAWDAHAARMLARPMAERVGLDTMAFCQRILELTSESIAREVVTKVLEDGQGAQLTSVDGALVRMALSPKPGALLSSTLRLGPRLVAVGAPAGVYLPYVAELLHTEITIPRHAEVANAVGAVVGSVVARLQALILPQAETDLLRVHLPDQVRDFATLPDALAYAESRGRELVIQEALRRGATDLEIRVQRSDHTAPSSEGARDDIYIHTVLEVSATGRPELAR